MTMPKTAAIRIAAASLGIENYSMRKATEKLLEWPDNVPDAAIEDLARGQNSLTDHPSGIGDYSWNLMCIDFIELRSALMNRQL